MHTVKAAGITFIAGLLAGALAFTLIGGGGGISPAGQNGQSDTDGQDEEKDVDTSPKTNVQTFSSAEDFREYLSRSDGTDGLGVMGGFGRRRDIALEEPARLEAQAPTDAAAPSGRGGEAAKTPSRVSETNVQVEGIDEPDIVKTNGEEIFFSPPDRRLWRSFSPVPPRPTQDTKTKSIRAFPPERVSKLSEIDKGGTLLLNNQILAVISGDAITGYDVSDASSPTESWNVEVEEDSSIVESRLRNGTLYIVAKTKVQQSDPCPVKPLRMEGEPISIPCTSIYRPNSPAQVDSTYTVMAVNFSDGSVQNKISFVGSNRKSVVYMSHSALYVTFYSTEGRFAIFSDFLDAEGDGLFPDKIEERIEQVNSYDISNRAKVTEMEVILEEFYSTVGKDERLRIKNEMSNRMSNYYERRKRDLEWSSIMKVNADNLQVEATGKVPGFPVNQFALDEHNDHLRVAVTVGERIGRFGEFGGESANDVYVLDSELNKTGSVQDLGLTERVYAARFMGDKGYVVTYRQTDPFYTLDLSDADDPRMIGELKIPGFSSYLHPLGADRVLGVGKEDGQVKLSLFDISNFANPQEEEKYTLDEYASEVLSNHHAFLQDEKHRVFFFPGRNGGYIFSYAGDKLELKRAVSKSGVRRAVFLNDFLYVIADEEIVVLDQNTWETVREIEI